MTETFQITAEQAEAYETLFVPALFAQWAGPLVEVARVRPGQRVLDVACGTGVVARAALEVVGGSGTVTGVDLNPAMLAVAARVQPDIGWHEGDVAALPFKSERFDAVLCQSGLFFFPDVPGAVAEMVRVLRPGGVLAIQTYASVDDQPGFLELERIVARFAPPDAIQLIETYWSQGDLPALVRILQDASLEVVETRTILGTAMYGSVDNLVETEIRGTPLVDRLAEEQIEQIVAESKTRLDGFMTSDGLAMPIRAHLLAGRRP